MRHIIHIGPLQFRNESEIPLTHVLIGRRDKEHFRPDIPPEKISMVGRKTAEQKLTNDEQEALYEFSRREIRGDFELKPLVWCESEADAEGAKSRFTEPEWIDLSIVPAKTTIP